MSYTCDLGHVVSETWLSLTGGRRLSMRSRVMKGGVAPGDVQLQTYPAHRRCTPLSVQNCAFFGRGWGPVGQFAVACRLGVRRLSVRRSPSAGAVLEGESRNKNSLSPIKVRTRHPTSKLACRMSERRQECRQKWRKPAGKNECSRILRSRRQRHTADFELGSHCAHQVPEPPKQNVDPPTERLYPCQRPPPVH